MIGNKASNSANSAKGNSAEETLGFFGGLGNIKKEKLSTDTVRKIHSEDQALIIEEFVVKAQEGDADSFGKLYDHFADPIYKYVFYRVPEGEAEDIVETVFLKAWEKLFQYKPQKKSFSAWLFRIAHNLIVDRYRFKKDKEYAELGVEIAEHRRDYDPKDFAEGRFNNSKLKKAISGLNKNYKEIIILKFINELGNEEVAKITGKSEGSIRILQFRALKALKLELEKLGMDFEVL